ncbi:ATP-binding protein [Pseudomonas fluorescens]|uniref:ATP-binding protein n=1 Tax=Pseudomonas fluorescens TaxID=294 RepID=UPI001486239B|nr:transporter substrate-binding domain-containing protein [Pseudomonas fluorescens]
MSSHQPIAQQGRRGLRDYRALAWRTLLVLLLCPVYSQHAHAQGPLQLAPQAGLPQVKPVLAPYEWSWLQARPVLRLGVAEQDYGPLSLLRNHTLKGLMADYLSIIANSLGLRVEVTVYPSWPQALQGLRAGEVDVLGLGSSYEAQLPGLLLSLPYTVNQPVLVGRDSQSEPSFLSSRLATVQGYASAAELQALFPDAQVQVYPTVHQALHAVAYKHADWAVCDALTAVYQLGLGELSNLRMRSLNLPYPGYSFVLRKSDSLLQALFNRVLADITPVAQANIRAYWAGGVYVHAAQESPYNAEQQAWLATQPQIQVVANGAMPPYSFFDDEGHYSGLVADLLSEISLRSGLRFNVLERASTKEVVLALQSGEAQLSPFMLMTPEHPAILNFTEPFGVSTFALVGRQGATFKDLKDLRNKRVALTYGSPAIALLRDSEPDIEVVETNNPLDSLRAVTSGYAQAAVILLPIARYLVDQDFSKQLTILTSLPALQANLAFSVTKEQALLLQVINTTLSRMEPRMAGNLLERWQDGRSQGHVWGRHEGRLRWVVLSIGTLMGMLLMGIFYTLYRRIQAHTEQGRQAFRSALLGGLPQPVVMRDLNGVFLLCNDAFYTVFGLSPADVIGRTWEEVKGLRGVQTSDQKRAYQALLWANEPDVRLVNFSLHGVVRSYRQWSVPHRETNGRCVGLLMGWIDMSDTERLLQQLYAVRDQAVQASEAKTRFLTVMSHEIRTPLNVIIGLLELTLARVDKGEGWDRSAIEVAHASSSALMVLIGEILDLSKIESGKLTLESQRHNPRDIVETVRQIFHEVARQKGLYLIVQVQLDSEKDAMMDGVRLKQVLFNLLSNAIKFTDQGGIHLSLHAQQVGADLCMEFVLEDTGIGISPEQLQLLFQPFTQLSGPASGRGGTGLGLVICQQLVELMKGHLQLTSTPQQGTRVTLTLNAPALEAAAAQSPPSPPAQPASPLRVLLVDDHPSNRLLLWRQLVFLGHTVQETEDGQQAFDLIREQVFDVVITDCSMPVMDGYELTRLIRAREREEQRTASLVIGFTANAQASERQRCLAAGMNGCLFKPVSLDMLRTCLSEATAGNHRVAPSASPAATASAVFDLEIFNSLTGSDPHLEQLLLDSLYTTNCLDLQQFDELVSARQWYELVRLIHRIKGAARMVGAQVLIDAAQTYAQHEHEHEELSEEQMIQNAVEVRRAIVQLQQAVAERLGS